MRINRKKDEKVKSRAKERENSAAAKVIWLHCTGRTLSPVSLILCYLFTVGVVTWEKARVSTISYITYMSGAYRCGVYSTSQMRMKDKRGPCRPAGTGCRVRPLACSSVISTNLLGIKTSLSLENNSKGNATPDE